MNSVNKNKKIMNKKEGNKNKKVSNENKKVDSGNKKVSIKEWKQFKSNYTFLILGLLIYALRPLRINSNSSELSYTLEIINKSLSKENYKEELNLIIRFITSQFVKINSNAREKIIEKSSTKSKILEVLKLLLNVNSFTDFYTKISKYDFSLTNNKDFFNFIASLINFQDSTKSKSLNIDTRSKYIIFFIKRNTNSALNNALSKATENNVVYDDKIKKYKNILITVATEFFKNMAKNNSVQFVNSKLVLKKNINSIPTNKNSNLVQQITNTTNVKIKNNSTKQTSSNIVSTPTSNVVSTPTSNVVSTPIVTPASNVVSTSIVTPASNVVSTPIVTPASNVVSTPTSNVVSTPVLENVSQMKISGGNKNGSKSKNKSKSKNISFKNMWWLKKYE